jgi:thiosulfate/3-mercaptopyruvate sulfurtransferase
MGVICHRAVRRFASIGALAALLTAAGLCSCSAPPPTKEYPRAELLMEPTALAKAGVAAQFVVLDARPKKAFTVNRIPGACWVDEAEWAKVFGSGADAEDWSGRIGSLGIDRDSKVVVYDGSCFTHAARIWWILRYWGVTDVRLLNGGWQGWKKAGLPLEQDNP